MSDKDKTRRKVLKAPRMTGGTASGSCITLTEGIWSVLMTTESHADTILATGAGLPALNLADPSLYGGDK